MTEVKGNGSDSEARILELEQEVALAKNQLAAAQAEANHYKQQTQVLLAVRLELRKCVRVSSRCSPLSQAISALHSVVRQNREVASAIFSDAHAVIDFNQPHVLPSPAPGGKQHWVPINTPGGASSASSSSSAAAAAGAGTNGGAQLTPPTGSVSRRGGGGGAGEGKATIAHTPTPAHGGHAHGSHKDGGFAAATANSGKHPLTVAQSTTTPCAALKPRVIRSFVAPDPVAALLALDKEGARFASVGETGVSVWDAKSGASSQLLGHEKPVLCVARVNEQGLVTGSADRTLRVWNLTTGACSKVLSGHTGLRAGANAKGALAHFSLARSLQAMCAQSR